MIPKFSVRRPYTVIVGILLVLVLGFVSLTRLSSDLLPDMNLPYAIVLTTYTGASPDSVERVVTVPLEESMATVSGIDTITSSSSENYSLVILKFADGTNMDSTTVEMREKLDQLESGWNDDNIGSPLIMKINPDMAPIVVAAVDMDGKDQKQLTDFVNDVLIAKLESMGGVASVSAAGQIEAEIQVIVRQDKIDTLNRKITAILDDQFADAQKKLDDGKDELADGKDELDEQKESVAKQIAEGENKVVDGKITAITTKSQLQQQITQLQGQLEEVKKGIVQIEEAEAQKPTLTAAIASLTEVQAQVADLETKRDDAQAQLDELRSGLDTPSEPFPDFPRELPSELYPDLPSDLFPDLPSELPDDFPQMPDLENPSGEGLSGADGTTDTGTGEQPDTEQNPDAAEGQEGAGQSSPTPYFGIESTLAELEAMITAMDEALNQIAEGLKAQGITPVEGEKLSVTIAAKIVELTQAAQQLDEAIAQKETLIQTQAQIEDGLKQLEKALRQIESGESTLSDALTQINTSGILASIELGSASAQLASAEAQLESAQAQLDSAKDTAYDAADADQILTVNTVISLLTAQNFEMPAGYITEGEDSLLVRVGENIQNLEELRALPLMDMGMDGLDTIRLEDVADIVVQDNSEEVYAKVNGNGALILSLLKQDGYSTGDVSKAVLARFEALEKEYPGLHFSVLSDQGVYIDIVVKSVVEAMAYGALLAVVVLLLFLKDLRPTLIIAVSIPVSAVLALVFMYMANVSINMMSLGGLSLGIGMLVDNSVVVLENIYRYRSLGYNIWSAAVAGTKEVLGAIVASTLTTVCVFTGLLFTEGIVIDMLIALALSFSFALLGSLIIAMTFVPMISSLLMRRDKVIRHPWFDRFTAWYGRFLYLCLRFKAVVILLALVLLVTTGSAILRRGFSFMPEMASTQASISLTTPQELSFSETMEIAEQVAERIRTVPDVEAVGVQSGSTSLMSTMVGAMFGGRGGSGDGDDNSASFYVVFSEERTISNEEFTRQVEEKCADLNAELNINASSMDLSSLTGNGITVRIYGKDKDTLQELAVALADRLSELDGVSEVDNGLVDASDQLKVTVDKEKAAKHSLTVAQIFQTVAGKIARPTAITTLELEEGDFDLYVKKDSDSDMTREQLGEIVLPENTKSGGTPSFSFGDDDEDEEEEEEPEDIHLSDVAEISTTLGLDTINRYNQQRYLSITAFVEKGHSVTLVSDDVQRSLNRFPFPDGYYVDYSGESETIMESMGKLLEMLALALVCIYLVMVAQFQSLLHPFIIMFTIPLAFTGGFMALLLAGRDISVLAMIGFILLAGVIVNNGIVMIDYINQLRIRGMSKREAIIEAGQTRMRPVLMTALTTVFAQTFMAMGDSMGAAMTKPMALVTVGGLLYGTVMTLVFVPCIYDLFTSNKPMQELEIDDTLIKE